MKLYLSSYKLGAEPKKFAALFGDNKKVAIIMNAGDAYGPAKRSQYLQKETAALAEIGPEGHDLDLRNYFKDTEALRVRLSQYGGVWAMGGNSSHCVEP